MKIALDAFLFKLYLDNFDDYVSLQNDFPVGVEIADFTKPEVLSDSAVYTERMQFYRKELSNMSRLKTFHGPFWGINPHCGDLDVRQLSRDKIKAAIDTAQEIGCGRIVFHTGYLPMINMPDMIEKQIDISSQFWEETVQSCNIEICLENTWEPDTYFLSSVIKNSAHQRLNVCIDTGHIFAFSRLTPREWFSSFGAKITHLHWHDNHLEFDEHLALGRGKIDWQLMYSLRQQHCPQSDIVLEMKTSVDFKDSLEYLKENLILDLS